MARTQGLRGIDVSHYQQTTPDGKVMRASDDAFLTTMAGLSFIAIKATHGSAKNSGWDAHYANARLNGLVVMAYHWGRPASADPIEAQVAKFLEVAKDADFLWLDQEETGFDDAQAQRFIDLVRASGRPCGLYHSASGFGGVNADGKWVADYRDASIAAGYPRRLSDGAEMPGWDLWQWTSKGGAGGLPLDLDWLNPASPLAGLLRRGYITRAASDADIAAARKVLEGEVVSLKEAMTQMANAYEKELADQAADAAAAKDAAVAQERETIAQAMGQDMADKVRNAR